MQKISIDPITRLEGHGKIDIFLNDAGDVANAYLIIPELRGFEKFAEGRPVEELPRITPRICGVCPEGDRSARTGRDPNAGTVPIPARSAANPRSARLRRGRAPTVRHRSSAILGSTAS